MEGNLVLLIDVILTYINGNNSG